MPTSISGCFTSLFWALHVTVYNKKIYRFHLRGISLSVWRFHQSPLGTCVASRVCIQIATPRLHCHVIALCTQLMLTGYTILHSLQNHWKRSRLERRRLVCAFPRRRDLAYFMYDVFTILYFKTHHCIWDCNLLSFSWAQTHNNSGLQWLAKKDVQRSCAIFPTDQTDCSEHLEL